MIALYALLIGMPLAGWLILSADGKSIPFFGLQLPALFGESKEVAELAREIHETGGTVGYFLIRRTSGCASSAHAGNCRAANSHA